MCRQIISYPTVCMKSALCGVADYVHQQRAIMDECVVMVCGSEHSHVIQQDEPGHDVSAHCVAESAFRTDIQEGVSTALPPEGLQTRDMYHGGFKYLRESQNQISKILMPIEFSRTYRDADPAVRVWESCRLHHAGHVCWLRLSQSPPVSFPDALLTNPIHPRKRMREIQESDTAYSGCRCI